jgi:hypothetical protein
MKTSNSEEIDEGSNRTNGLTSLKIISIISTIKVKQKSILIYLEHNSTFL